RHKRPIYRVVAADSRMPRDGRFLEILGIFDPLKDAGLPELKQERVLTWLHQGAQPTVTVKTTSPEMVTIGRIDRPFGVHGAVKVRSLSDRPGRFEGLKAVRVAGQGGQ